MINKILCYLLQETYGWVPFEKCIHILQSKQYYSLGNSELFNPRVKGLLITMVAEKRAREKTKETLPKTDTEGQVESCPMETDAPAIDTLGIHEQRRGSGSGSSDEESYKRKRPQDGSPAPSEYMRSGKRPSRPISRWARAMPMRPASSCNSSTSGPRSPWSIKSPATWPRSGRSRRAG